MISGESIDLGTKMTVYTDVRSCLGSAGLDFGSSQEFKEMNRKTFFARRLQEIRNDLYGANGYDALAPGSRGTRANMA